MSDGFWVIILIGIVALVWYLIAKGRSSAADPEPSKSEIPFRLPDDTHYLPGGLNMHQVLPE